ncbi:hypothetical protein OTU49_014793 [Cherax quadricarinatus]|uniref:Uncharacterized protein n=1 Tax=Cherax quadricarinatus TaxID=27406 RepID=A0AAW0YEM2_CHEQU
MNITTTTVPYFEETEAGCVWIYVVFCKCGPRHRRPNWHEDLEELGCLPDPHRHYHAKQRRGINANENSGVSRSLGLHASYLGEQLPTLPTPRSWTPSPPHNPHHMHTTAQINKQEATCCEELGNAVDKSCETQGGTEPLYGSRARTSPYNPRYNTPTSDKWSHTHSLGTNSSYTTQGLHNQHEDRRRECEARFTGSGARAFQTRHFQKRRTSVKEYKHITNKRYPQNLDKHQHEPIENPARMLQGDVEYPDTCYTNHSDSYHLASSNLHFHRRGCEHVDPPRARSSDNLASDLPENSRLDTLLEGSEEHERCQITAHRSPTTSNEKKEPLNYSHPLVSTVMRERHPRFVSDAQQTQYTLPRAVSCVSPRPQPQRMKHYQASSHLGMWVPQREQRYPSKDLLFHQHHDLSCVHNSQRDRDQEVRRRMALKYGFCQACGVHSSPRQRMKRQAGDAEAQHKSQYTQTLEDDLNSCSTDVEEMNHSLAPSMSWDNLTPELSAVLTDTLPGTSTVEDASADRAPTAGACCVPTHDMPQELGHSDASSSAHDVIHKYERRYSNSDY